MEYGHSHLSHYCTIRYGYSLTYRVNIEAGLRTPKQHQESGLELAHSHSKHSTHAVLV